MRRHRARVAVLALAIVASGATACGADDDGGGVSLDAPELRGLTRVDVEAAIGLTSDTAYPDDAERLTDVQRYAESRMICRALLDDVQRGVTGPTFGSDVAVPTAGRQIGSNTEQMNEFLAMLTEPFRSGDSADAIRNFGSQDACGPVPSTTDDASPLISVLLGVAA